MSTPNVSGLIVTSCIGLGLVLVMMFVLTLIGIFHVASISSALTSIGDVNSVKHRDAITSGAACMTRPLRFLNQTHGQACIVDKK